MQKKNDGMAIASMVLGIVGLLLACVVIGIVPAIIGLILGIICLAQKKDGKGMAIAGIATAAVAILVFIIATSGVGDATRETAETSKIQEPAKEEAAGIEVDQGTKDDAEIVAQTATEDDSKAVIEEQVLLEQDSIKITATGISDGLVGPEINLLIENNSSTNFTVQVRSMSVNGFMVSSIFSSEVAPGKKNNDSISISSSDLESCGIERIADILLTFHIFDSESWDTILDSDTIEIKTSLSGNIDQAGNDQGEVLYDESGIRIIAQGIVDDSIFGPGLKLYIENNSDQDITIQTRGTSVNGFMVEPTFSPEIASGKKTIATMTFMSSDLEESGITDINEIETSFHIFLTDGWDTITDTSPVTITF